MSRLAEVEKLSQTGGGAFDEELEKMMDTSTLAKYYQNCKQELADYNKNIKDSRKQILIAEEAERTTTQILDKVQIRINERLKELEKQELETSYQLENHKKIEATKPKKKLTEELDNIKSQIQTLQSLPGMQLQKASSIALGKTVWAKYFGDIGTEPPFPKDIDKILKNPCSIWPGKKVYQTHMLVLVPEKVNGNPLNLRALGELIKTPKQGNSTRYQFFCSTALKQYGDIPAPASHWILMTRNVIPSSRNKNHESCTKIIESYKKYEMPKVLDAATALFMEYMNSGTRLYNDNPSTYTHCQEPCDDYHLVVGCFAPSGLYINSDSFHLGDYVSIGVGALWKF